MTLTIFFTRLSYRRDQTSAPASLAVTFEQVGQVRDELFFEPVSSCNAAFFTIRASRMHPLGSCGGRLCWINAQPIRQSVPCSGLVLQFDASARGDQHRRVLLRPRYSRVIIREGQRHRWRPLRRTPWQPAQARSCLALVKTRCSYQGHRWCTTRERIDRQGSTLVLLDGFRLCIARREQLAGASISQARCPPLAFFYQQMSISSRSPAKYPAKQSFWGWLRQNFQRFMAQKGS